MEKIWIFFQSQSEYEEEEEKESKAPPLSEEKLPFLQENQATPIIRFEKLSLSYSGQDSPKKIFALKSISFTIHQNQKIAFCGRYEFAAYD